MGWWRDGHGVWHSAYRIEQAPQEDVWTSRAVLNPAPPFTVFTDCLRKATADEVTYLAVGRDPDGDVCASCKLAPPF